MMGGKTSIEWTDASWSPIRARHRASGKLGWHCEHVSPGCASCYSEAFNRDRLGTRLAFKPGHRDDVEIFLDTKMLTQPLRWTKPRRIFVCSMTDLFADFVPDAMIDQVFAVMALAHWHKFQVLTKRSARMRAYLSAAGVRERIIWAAQSLAAEGKVRAIFFAFPWPFPNVWLGVSCEDQRRADERVPDLKSTPAAVRFVSAEPLLGGIDFTRIACPTGCSPPEYCNHCHPDGGQATGTFDVLSSGAIDWIIVGGETGLGARPMHPAWARAIRDQCASAGVSFLFKQWGSWEVAVDRERDDPDWRRDYRFELADADRHRWLNADGGQGFHGEQFHVLRKVSKARAGRLLDGVEHNGMPEVLGRQHTDIKRMTAVTEASL